MGLFRGKLGPAHPITKGVMPDILKSIRVDPPRPIIRPASPEMAETAARLLYLTMQPLTAYWMGVDNADAAQRFLGKLFRGRGNLFSYEFAEVADLKGQVAGFLLDYPAATMKRLEAPTLLQFLRIAGLRNALRMVMRSLPLQGIAQAGPDEYFLAHLAVLPQFEGRGIGQLLLRR